MHTIRIALSLVATPLILIVAQMTTSEPAPTLTYPDIAEIARFEQGHPILPSVAGFGSTTVAGSGRHLRPPRTLIYRVKTVADSGPGSLRECVNLAGPRTCIFEVSGEISVRSILRIRNPYITIAGQTAPKPGVTLTRGGVSIETHDVLIQHLAVRPGDNPRGVEPRFRDGVSIGAAPPRSAHNVVLDHLSLTWAIDENLSTAYPSTHDITIANSLIAEGLYNSIHPKGPHSKGVMIGNDSQRVTLSRNVLAANEERNPYIKPGSSVEMINNVVYGWGPRGGWSLCNLSNNDGSPSPVRLTFIGNVYIPGPWSFIGAPIYANFLALSSRIYVEDNVLLAPADTPSEPWNIASIDEETFRADTPPITAVPRERMLHAVGYRWVLFGVGSRPHQRSPIDRRIISDVEQRTGSIKDCLSGCVNRAGPSTPLTSRTRTLRTPRVPFADSNRDGYTNLENWLHALARRVERAPT